MIPNTQDLKKIINESFFQSRSRCRRLQYEWLESIKGELVSGPVLDVGGTRKAEYHAILGLSENDLTIWNLAPATGPDELVDLDRVETLPAFPVGARVVLAMNVLEHLYRPLELLSWICRNLPKGGQLIVSTPFCYPIHPSPNDYWRITPQAYERFFSELERDEGILGELKVECLGADYRDGISLLTTPLFFGKRPSRLAAVVTEKFFAGGSRAVEALIGEDRLRQWAKQNAPAIGLTWIKN